MTRRMSSRAGGVLAVAVTGLALAGTAVPVSARTFDFAAGSMVQQPLPTDFACMVRRATLDRVVLCLDIDVPRPARHSQPATSNRATFRDLRGYNSDRRQVPEPRERPA
jgi:hypothetical protein